LPKLQKLNGELIQLLVHSKIKQDSARANIYRMVSEIEIRSETRNPNFIHFYKYSISSFAKEGLRSKFEILSLVSKALLMITIQRQENDSLMSSVLFDQRRVYQLGFEHLMRLARYDSDFIARDRARFLQGLMMSAQGLTIPEDAKGHGMVEVDGHHEHHDEGITLLDESTAFTRGHEIPSQPTRSSCLMEQESTRKLSLNELKQILFLDPEAEPVNLVDLFAEKEFEASSLFRIAGVKQDESSGRGWKYLDWNTVPPWAKTALDARLREPEEGAEKQQGTSSVPASSGSHQGTMSGFSQDRSSMGRSQTKERVVLIPTGSDDDLASTNQRASSSAVGASGRRNLEDFLQSSADEDSHSDLDAQEDSSQEDSSQEDSSRDDGQDSQEDSGSGSGSGSDSQDHSHSQTDD